MIDEWCDVAEPVEYDSRASRAKIEVLRSSLRIVTVKRVGGGRDKESRGGDEDLHCEADIVGLLFPHINQDYAISMPLSYVALNLFHLELVYCLGVGVYGGRCAIQTHDKNGSICTGACTSHLKRWLIIRCTWHRG